MLPDDNIIGPGTSSTVSQDVCENNGCINQKELQERQLQQEVTVLRDTVDTVEQQQSFMQQRLDILTETMAQHVKDATCTRRDLAEITRKKLLSPVASRLYNTIVKMKRQRRRCQRRVQLYNSRRNKQGPIIENSGNIKDILINLMKNNSNVAPQVET